MASLEGKVAIVTGAANGIGRAIAEAMARDGARVIVADRDLARADVVASGIAAQEGVAVARRVDVRSRADVEALVAFSRDTFAPPTVLVNCAGIAFAACASGVQGILDMTEPDWDTVLDVNLRGTFYCAQAVTRLLVAEGLGGSLITVSSIAATRPTIDRDPAYHASKGGVVALMRSLAVKLAPHGIRANDVSPGYVLTDLTRDGLDDSRIWTAVHDRIPLGRMGGPGDISGAAIFLASDASGYMTGQQICVDGGTTILGWTPATYSG